jgi:hypothetical protein
MYTTTQPSTSPAARWQEDPGWSAAFEVIVPGEYVWRTSEQGRGLLRVGDHALGPGDSVMLDERGYYELRLPEGGEGMLVLALPEPPAPGSARFYRGH